MYEVKQLSKNVYYTTDKQTALDKAKSLSIETKDIFTVIYSYSKIHKDKKYFIERGTPLIRNNEVLIVEYDKGELL